MDLGFAIGDAVDAAFHTAEAAAGNVTKVDERIIADVRRKLIDCASEFDGNQFRHAKIAGSSFGGSPEGRQLGSDHSQAQDVIQETLLGVVDDLTAFSGGVRQAADLVQHADGMSAAQARAIANKLSSASLDCHGDQANDDGKNHRHYHSHGQYHHVGGRH